MSTINTRDELDALPVDSVIVQRIDWEGEDVPSHTAAIKTINNMWVATVLMDYAEPARADELLDAGFGCSGDRVTIYHVFTPHAGDS